MDAHFNEYLAAVVGMQELYGLQAEDHPTEFHDDVTPSVASAGPSPAGAPVSASL
ncbi:MAG: hypothetical protein ACKO4Z_03780 [Planctomycetota bacterium]